MYKTALHSQGHDFTIMQWFIGAKEVSLSILVPFYSTLHVFAIIDFLNHSLAPLVEH